jgi:ferric-dicitrate binding protein FerR (iron transport regulator)
MSGTRPPRLDHADTVRRLVRRLKGERAPSLPSDRRRLVAAVEQALHARARRRSFGRRAAWAATGLAAAAAALLVVPRFLTGSGDGLVSRHALTVLGADGAGAATASLDGRAPEPLRHGMRLREGLRLVAPPSGEVRVGTADGTSLALEPKSDLTVDEAGNTQRFSLHAGAVRARVSRLFAGERFIVDTTDAEIEVHGTAFRVAVVAGDPACREGTTTRVSVDEGVVTVRRAGREVRLTPGQTWPAGCATGPTPVSGEAAAAPARVASQLRPTSEPRVARASHAPARHQERPLDRAPAERPEPAAAPAAPAPAPIIAPAPVTAPAPARAAPIAASELAAENELFAMAVRARKEGRLVEALRYFGRLCDEHPRSPLAESATVQRMRVLAGMNPAEGARAAAAYVARYPGGFAHAEAQALIDRARP